MSQAISEPVTNHLKRHGYTWIFMALTLQLAQFFYTNVYPVYYETGLNMTDYQQYQVAFFLCLLSAMYYFVIHAVIWTSPSEIFTFLILAAILNVYMIFRDFVFLNWPHYYFEQVSKINSSESSLEKL